MDETFLATHSPCQTAAAAGVSSASEISVRIEPPDTVHVHVPDRYQLHLKLAVPIAAQADSVRFKTRTAKLTMNCLVVSPEQEAAIQQADASAGADAEADAEASHAHADQHAAQAAQQVKAQAGTVAEARHAADSPARADQQAQRARHQAGADTSAVDQQPPDPTLEQKDAHQQMAASGAAVAVPQPLQPSIAPSAAQLQLQQQLGTHVYQRQQAGSSAAGPQQQERDTEQTIRWAHYALQCMCWCHAGRIMHPLMHNQYAQVMTSLSHLCTACNVETQSVLVALKSGHWYAETASIHPVGSGTLRGLKH